MINMSLSTTKRQFAGILHEARADTAYFRRTVLVASAHNMPVELPVAVLVGHLSRKPRESDSFPNTTTTRTPPVEFFARGVDVEVAWLPARQASGDGERLCHSAHERDLCAGAGQAP